MNARPDHESPPGVLGLDLAEPVPDCSPILAIDKWPTNGHLIADCARLGYLRKEWLTLDPTYGYGTFWKVWQPDELVACDLNPAKSPIGYPVDFTDLPWSGGHFRAAVYDGPYKLNGNPSDTDGIDERFGVEVYTRWQDRLDLLVRGAVEVARVTDEYLLVKCQDQVVSGKLRWQTIAITEALESAGFGLKDRMEFLGRRGQPAGRGQNNAHRASSQMLVFKRGWGWRP